jgi:DNA polymerase-3 subunit chi
MTQIDFRSNVADKIGYACVLVRKARAANFNVVLYAEDASLLRTIDEFLWNFSEQEFLPHVMAEDPNAAFTPVVLTADDNAELPHRQVLINLSPRTPACFAQFDRFFEIVSTAAEDVAAGRERYRYYQQRGYPLTHIVSEEK